MRLMNHVLKFVVVYFNDILIYSMDLDTNLGHLKSVLIILKECYLFANLDECKSWQRRFSC